MDIPNEKRFVKASNCGGGECVEVAITSNQVYLRDSKSPGVPALAFSPSEWNTFITAVKSGEFGTF